MVSIRFRTALVEIDEYNIVSTFNDGKVNHFPIGFKDEEYKDIARMYGYEDWKRYAIEHELAHHFVADNMGWKWSWSLHSSAGKKGSDFKGEWPDHIAWEERIVNQFQLYVLTEQPDPLNVLHLAFRDDLEKLAGQFEVIVMLALDGGRDICYDHNTNRIGLVNEQCDSDEDFGAKSTKVHLAY